MEIHWGRFAWRILPIWLLPAALCWHRHKQDASHQWGSKRRSILKTKCWEKYCQMEQKTWVNCLIVTDKPEFNCSEYRIWKCPSFSVSICWKFAYRQSLKPNYLKGNQQYSSHSVECPTSHFAEEQTQWPLWLYTFKYIFVLTVIFWTWSSPLFQDNSDFQLAIGQSPDNDWLRMLNEVM